MIKPTVGRIVLYVPASYDSLAYDAGDKLPAIITKVWSDRCVNLAVFDADGKHVAKTSVGLAQPEDATPSGGGFCEWMPYR